MQSQLVLTLIGKDRPGLVEALATTVAGHGGNWLESRMCHLGGEFAGLLQVELPADREAALTAALSQLDTHGLQVVVRPNRQPLSPATAGAMLEIVGQDRPGIVKQISQALAEHRINVEDLHTERTCAPMSGEMLFRARIGVMAPPDCDLAAVRQTLEKIAADLMVEIHFTQPA
jgi:glycine cleavage system regulatory protein